MRYASVVRAAAICCPIGLFANVPAQADIFDFTYGPGVSGLFATKGPSPTDLGYEDVGLLLFETLSGTTDSGAPFDFTNEVATKFQAGAAFDPTTGAFINHALGRTFNDIGVFFTPDITIQGRSFSQSSSLLLGSLPGVGSFVIREPLKIKQVTSGASVPEASTWAMILLGFCGLGLAARRRRPGAVTIASPAGGNPCHS